jgi:hypothetical protein
MGDNSMFGKRMSREAVNRLDPQDPSDRAKADLPESQGPVNQKQLVGYNGCNPDGSRDTRVSIQLWEGHRAGDWVAVSHRKDLNVTPTSLYHDRHDRKAGSPAGREPYGDGDPIVVVGVTPHHGERENRSQGEVGQVRMDSQALAGMRNAGSPKSA